MFIAQVVTEAVQNSSSEQSERLRVLSLSHPCFFFFFCPITTVRVGSTQEGKYSSLLCSALGLNVPEMMEGI